MAIPAWPTSLPQLRSSLQTAGTDELLPAARETEMEDGVRARQTSRVRRTPHSMTMRMTLAQLAAFYDFYDTSIGRGAGRFTGPVFPVAGGAAVTRTCRISGKVGVRYPASDSVLVSFILIVANWK